MDVTFLVLYHGAVLPAQIVSEAPTQREAVMNRDNVSSVHTAELSHSIILLFLYIAFSLNHLTLHQ